VRCINEHILYGSELDGDRHRWLLLLLLAMLLGLLHLVLHVLLLLLQCVCWCVRVSAAALHGQGEELADVGLTPAVGCCLLLAVRAGCALQSMAYKQKHTQKTKCGGFWSLHMSAAHF
jgi:hypothetical protein